VKAALPALDDRVVARVFKALTDTDLSHRAVRRPARVNDLMAASGADQGDRRYDHPLSLQPQEPEFRTPMGWPGD
jgi:hypothetical protein